MWYISVASQLNPAMEPGFPAVLILMLMIQALTHRVDAVGSQQTLVFTNVTYIQTNVADLT